MSKKGKIDGGFILIPKQTIRCNKYKSLRPHTRAVFEAILTEFIRPTAPKYVVNPLNKVKITHNQMEDISGISHGSVVRAVKELKEKNFIRTLIPGGLEGNPTTFQLNKRYLSCGIIDAYW